MIIKAYLVNLAARITGRKCSKCTHNCSGRCCHPSGHMFAKCWQSVTRPGFEKQKPMETTNNLTSAEQEQLNKIKEALQEAGDTARESGLL